MYVLVILVFSATIVSTDYSD